MEEAKTPTLANGERMLDVLALCLTDPGQWDHKIPLAVMSQLLPAVKQLLSDLAERDGELNDTYIESDLRSRIDAMLAR